MNKYIKLLVESFFDDLDDDIQNPTVTDIISDTLPGYIEIKSKKTPFIIKTDNGNVSYDIIPSKFNKIVVNMNAYLWILFPTVLQSIKFNIDSPIKCNISWLFKQCKNNIKHIEFNMFNITKLNRLDHLFQECKYVKTLDLSEFNTFNIYNMAFMFSYCISLTTLNVNNFNTSNVVNMENMFDGCESLQELDISNFDMRQVQNIQYMFSDCKNLHTINLGKFDIFHIKDYDMYYNLFRRCLSLKNIICTLKFKTWAIKHAEDISLFNVDTINWQII